MRKLLALAAALAASFALAQTVTTDPSRTGVTVPGSGGFGTVTSVGVTTANGVSASVANPTTTPALSFTLGAITPTSVSTGTLTGTLTNSTGLPVSTGVSGLGTGIATALGVNVGTAGAPVVNGGALGTPSSGVATNLTGTATGLTANTATFTASQTGTGSTYVTNTSPTLGTPTLTIPKLSTQTWANLPAAAGNTGAFTIASDLGTNGTIVTSNGSRWRPVSGMTTLAALGASVSGITNAAETIVLQTRLPAGAWQTNDSIFIWLDLNKSGTTDVGNVTIRVGTGGTTSDTAITGASAQSILTAANQTIGAIWEIKLISATSAQRVGSALTGGGSYSGGSATAPFAATTITDASANQLYISVGFKSAGATNTVGIDGGRIQLFTP